MTMYQREQLKAIMAPLMQEIAKVAPTATRDELTFIGFQIVTAAPAITNCFNGAEQFPQKDPNQLELPI